MNATSASFPAFAPARRSFLVVSAAAGGGLLLGVALPGGMAHAAAPRQGALQPNAFIRITRDGSVTLVMHKAEMGQGVFTALAQLIAEELEVPLAAVHLEQAPPDEARYGEPLFGGLQMTGGSTSIRGAWLPLRQAGATARELLVQAAAKTWRGRAAGLVARDGKVFQPSTGKRLGYGALVDVASTLPVPKGVPLKEPKDFRVIGKPLKRLDGRSKVEGTAKFGIDVKLVGMKIAAVASCPEFGGTLAGVDVPAAMKVSGVRRVVALGGAVAVVADNFWAAQQGLLAAAPRWTAGAHATLDSAQVAAQLDDAALKTGAVAAAHGDAPAALARAAQRIDAVYRAPFLAHMAMEPLNCTVMVRGGEVELFVGTQVPTRARDAAARAAGVDPAKVTVHNHLIGGAFGRRLEVDFIELAVSIAKQVEGPVKVVWSREEDVQHDMYRPYYLDTMSAGLDASGMPVAWTHRIAASSILARFLPPGFKDGVDGDAVEGATETPYAFPAQRVEYVRVEPPGIPTAFWRGVGATHNAFVVEGFIDELSAKAGRDPLDYRRALVRDPRARVVLDLAAAKADWGTKLPKRQGQGQGCGIALLHAFGSYVAQVVQVQVGDDGEVHVLRVVCAVDCGQVVNPSTVAAQMEGGIVFGLSAALWGEVTLAEGRVVQSNFHDYRVMRLNEAPRIEVHIVTSSEAPGGVGEPGTSVAIPALVNAIHAATGRRIRTLPIGAQLERRA